MAYTKADYFRLVGYTPHPKQQLFHASNKRFRTAVCGRRFGKSYMAARDMGYQLFARSKIFWIVGPTYDLGEKEFRVIWNDLIVGRKLGRDKRIKKAYSKRSGEMFIEFPWQTRVEVRSADHPENLVGEGLDGVIMSEAAKHRKDSWERFIQPALADRRGWATFPTTPEGFNWLYDLWAYGLDPKFPDYESWQFPSWENPYVYPLGRNDPEVLRQEATVLPAFFLQEIAAEFNAFVGKIYEEFREFTHVRPHVFRPDWPNYIAFDWGFVNPLAAIEFQVDPMDRIYVWREHYKAGVLLRDHIDMLKKREQPLGYRLDLCFGDAASPADVMTVSTDFCPCYADPRSKSGTRVKKDQRPSPESGWREGVELVKSFLQMRQTGILDEYGTPFEEPWLTVDPSCRNTIREFNNYRGHNTISSKVPRNPREDAQRNDDHAMDALRYALMHIFKLGATHKLSDLYDFDELKRQNDAAFSGTSSSGGFFSSNLNF